MSAGFAGLLQSAAGPIVKKALSALGIGVVSYAALITAMEGVKNSLTSIYGSITGDIAGLLGLAGFGDAIGIILGAMMARVTYLQLSRLQILAK